LTTIQVEISDDLEELVRRLHSQDNRATAEPLFCVEQLKRDYGIDPAYGSDDGRYVWHSEDWEWIIDSSDELIEELRREAADGVGTKPTPEQEDAIREAWDRHESVRTPDGSEYEICLYNERWEFVCAHFTEAAAEGYIEQNRHHFPLGARVYVTSQHRCYEWIAVRRFLLRLLDRQEVTTP
jgi:hypothetical protein